MATFETYTQAGELQISSDMKSILAPANSALALFADSNPGFSLAGVGMQSGVPGRFNPLYGVRNNNGLFTTDATKSYWVRIPDGGSITRINQWFGASTGTYIIVEGTNRLLNHTPGYLDIYSETGELVWSAASAGSVPTIRGVFPASRNQLWDKVGGAAMVIPGGPLFMVNALIGWSQNPEESIAETHAVSITRSGDTYYMYADMYSSFVSYAQAKADFAASGLNVPYATIFGL